MGLDEDERTVDEDEWKPDEEEADVDEEEEASGVSTRRMLISHLMISSLQLSCACLRSSLTLAGLSNVALLVWYSLNNDT